MIFILTLLCVDLLAVMLTFFTVFYYFAISMKKIVGIITLCVLSLWVSSVTFAADPSVEELLELILNNTGSVATGTITSWTLEAVVTVPATPVVETPAVDPSKEPIADEEFKNAVTWMYTNWLTQYSTPAGYEPYTKLTRQQAAKFFVVMQETILGKKDVTVNTNCTFTDTGFDNTLRPFVDKACKYGILMGSSWTFRPNAKISKPEFVTALIRMIEGAKRDESGNPWWNQYYQQAKTRWLTKELNANAFDTDTTRYEAALFLYRSLAILKTLNIPTTNNWSVTSWTVETTTPTTEPKPTQPVTSLVSDPILQEAIYWMNDHSMTKYTTVEQFRPFDTLSRQEAAKIFTLFRNITIQWTPQSQGISCAFDDLSIADQTLVSYIKEACKLQILKGSNNLFDPEGLLTKPQAVAILIRMIEAPLAESWATRWEVYYNRAVELGMIEPSQAINFDKPISRYEVAKLLYNSKVKYEIIKNLNNDYETNKLIYPVPGSMQTWAISWEVEWLISINTQILQRTDIDTYLIELFTEQYNLERQVTQKYLNNDYVRYGKLLSIDKTQELGTAAFTISNGVIIEGVIRPYGVEAANYTIKPSKSQPYYEMKRVLK